MNDKTASINSVEISVQPGRNGGTLRRGNPGNRGGGRRPDRIRRLALKALSKRVQLLGHFADGVAVHVGEQGEHAWQEVRPSERIKALEVLHKIGTGEQVSVHEVRSRLTDQLVLLRSHLDPQTFLRVERRLAEIWS